MAIQYTSVPTNPTNVDSKSTRRLPFSLPRWRTGCLIFNLSLFTSFLILGLVTYLSPSDWYMRPCLPFSLHRISKSAHRTLSCNYTTNTTTTSTTTSKMGTGQVNEADLLGSRLAGFLQSQKELFFQDLQGGKGKGWTVAVGNEAGGKSCLRPDGFELWAKWKKGTL